MNKLMTKKFLNYITIWIVLIIPVYSLANPILERLNYEAEVGLEFPLNFAVHSKLGLNKNIYARMGVGFASDVILKMGALAYKPFNLGLNDDEIQVVIKSISNSIYGIFSFGYRKSVDKGFYVDLGYSYMTLGHGEMAFDEFSNGIGLEVDNKEFGIHRELNPRPTVNVSLHNIVGHIGYKIPIEDNFAVSFEGGVIKPVHSNITMSVEESFTSEEKKIINDVRIIGKVEDIFSKLWMFTASFWVSYIF